VPSSPSHAAQVRETESQIGVAPPQLPLFPGVHCAQRPAPPAAVGLHTALRQTPLAPGASAVVQGPAPFGRPQTPSAPHVALRQRSEAPATQAPPPGMAAPVLPFGWQVCAVVSHH
jgi:hypothetical protein